MTMRFGVLDNLSTLPMNEDELPHRDHGKSNEMEIYNDLHRLK